MDSKQSSLDARMLANTVSGVVIEAGTLAGAQDKDFIREITQRDTAEVVEVEVAVELDLDKPFTLRIVPVKSKEPVAQEEEIPALVECADEEL